MDELCNRWPRPRLSVQGDGAGLLCGISARSASARSSPAPGSAPCPRPRCSNPARSMIPHEEAMTGMREERSMTGDHNHVARPSSMTEQDSDEELMSQLAAGRSDALRAAPRSLCLAGLRVGGPVARSGHRRGDHPGGLPHRLAKGRDLRPGAGHVPRLGLADHPLARAQ